MAVLACVLVELPAGDVDGVEDEATLGLAASISVTATVATKPSLRTAVLSRIASRPVLPAVGRCPELVPVPNPVADGRRYETQVAPSGRRACQHLAVPNYCPPGHPSVARTLKSKNKGLALDRKS